MQLLMDKAIFGENLKAARRATGLNQHELGKIVGVTNNMVCFYETGRYIPTLDRFVAICNALSVPPGALLSGAMAPGLPRGENGAHRASSPGQRPSMATPRPPSTRD